MTVDNQPRQQAKLPVSLCLKINEFLAPDQWPRFLHRVPEGGPVTYQLFGGEGAAEFLAPYTPEDVRRRDRRFRRGRDRAAVRTDC